MTINLSTRLPLVHVLSSAPLNGPHTHTHISNISATHSRGTVCVRARAQILYAYSIIPYKLLYSIAMKMNGCPVSPAGMKHSHIIIIIIIIIYQQHTKHNEQRCRASTIKHSSGIYVCQAAEMVFGCSMMTTLLLSRVVDLRDTDSDVVRVDIELRDNGAKLDELLAIVPPGAQRFLRHHGNRIQRNAGRAVRHICVEKRK